MSAAGPIGSSISDIFAIREQLLERNRLLQELRQAGNGSAASGTQQQPQGGDFAGSLKNALQGVNEVQQKSAAMTEAYERGEVTDIAKVMLARQEAGIAFEATLQVRNKLLSAYQEMMRMGV